MDLTDRIARALGAPPRHLVALSGGDLSVVAGGEDAEGRAFVAKIGPAPVEAAMLAAIARTGCPAPGVIHAEGDLLVLERLAEAWATPEGWRGAGAAVARMHACRGDTFGWPEATAFGPVLCPAPRMADWPAFWAEARLMAWPGALPADIAHRVERLAGDLGARLDHRPAPCLLHGDLWRGNVLFDGAGVSGLIDPACYFGDPEVDLAMLDLFGGPPPAFHDGYGARGAPGWKARRPLYQLWPALVHLRLFGGRYRGLVERLLVVVGA